MKVTQVAICPSEASRLAGRPALTPELLAASGARYSRNNEGLEAILSKIDPTNLERSVDAIFRMVDYGHQSIADMVPVALFIDRISLWLAYHIWSLSPTAGGQESSTRYLKLASEGLISPEELGLPADQIPRWREQTAVAFEAYQAALGLWEEQARLHPGLTHIPRALLEDTSEAAQKKVARMKRNYAFDRARYFLPVASATNVMLIMSARGWVQLCRSLLSHPLREAQRLGGCIRDEVQLVTPRLLKHATRSEGTAQVLQREFEKLVRQAQASRTEDLSLTSDSARPFLSVLVPDDVQRDAVAQDMAWHENRYSAVGTSLQRIGVRFGWSAVAFAEIRDLNRHRTGSKFCPQVPKGFYFARDQVSNAADTERLTAALGILAERGLEATRMSLERLQKGEPTHVYWALLGTEFPFEHLTSADRFIYEAELRTGLGAHFRYAQHLRDVLGLWYERFPETRKLVLEGSAEPE